MKTPALALTLPYYRGWTVMAGGFISTMLVVGGTLYVFGLFIVPVAEAFSLSRATVNNGLILQMLGMAIWSPLVGRALDRYPVRRIMLFGALMYGVGLLLIAGTRSPWLMGLAIIGPVALAVTSAGALAANTVTTRWFQRRRGRALGILAVATSAGGFVMTPLFAHVIERYGWQTTLVIAAIVLPALMIIAIICLVRDHPQQRDSGVSDEFPRTDTAAADTAPAAEKSWSFAELARARNFWLLGMGAGLLLASDMAIMATKVPYMLDQGISMARAALFVSCMTASAVCGKILVGLLVDRVDVRYIFGVVVLCHLALLATLIVMPDYWILISVASLFGIAIGGVYPVWLALSAVVFGARTYGTVIGSMAIIMQPLAIVAVRFIGEVHDRTGAYTVGFGVFMLTVLLSFVLVMLVDGDGGNKK